ncbi:MAG TPA: P-type conjugative transfer protein TrbJ [Sphingomicrobium sp.]|nr:P-type conjugative transfer protein TrbJ [Sphingomicrobium sp.]
MKIFRRSAVLLCAGLFPASATVLFPAPATASIPVFDAANYAQNIVQAARALEQINHQLQSLQNQAAMLSNMDRNLKSIAFPELGKIEESLERIDSLMSEAKGIDFSADQFEQRFDEIFPGGLDRVLGTDVGAAEARARLESARQGLRHTMRVQSAIVSNIRDDSRFLSELSRRSEGAEGSLQAQQVANQLLALGTKQQLQLQEMLAAQYRIQAFEQARKVQAETDAREATRRFLGTGKAYRPGN